MAFNLSGILSLNNSGFTRGMAQASSASDKLSGRVKGTGNAIKGMIIGAAGIAGIGLGIKNVTDVFVGFQKEMSNVKALTGETSDVAMKGLTEKAKEMGRILPASATDAAKAMSNLGSAGFSTKEIMQSVEGTLYLATSAQTDMATAADITSGTLRGFGLAAKDSGHLSDVLAMTAAKTNAGILDLGEGMKYAAPVMHAMGISAEETASAMGILANSNIKGSQAGTTLRSAMVRLTKPMKPAREAMQRLGFSAYDSQGKMKPLSQTIAELGQKTKGLTKEAKNQAIAQIFGTEALSGMLVLMDAGPEKINGLTNALKKSDGAAKKMAETQTDNLFGALQSVDGAFETLKINIGEKAAPAITKALKGMAGAIPAMGDAVMAGLDNFMEFAGSVINTVKPTLADLKNFIKTQLVPRFKDIGKVMSELYTTYEPELTSAFNLIKDAAGQLVTVGLDVVKAGFQWLVDNKELTCAAVVGVGSAFVASKVIILGSGIVGAVKTTMFAIQAVCGGAATVIEGISYVTGLTSAALFTAGILLAVAVFAIIAYECYKHWDGVKAATGALVNNMGVAFRNFGTDIKNVFASIGNFFIDSVVNPIIDGINKIPFMKLEKAAKMEYGVREKYESVGGAFKTAESQAAALKKLKTAGKSFDPTAALKANAAKHANGTAYFGGGQSLVNERGGEMQVLRNGTSIIPAEKTDKLLKGDNSGGGSTNIFNIDAKGMNVDELVTQLKLRLGNI